MMTPQRSDSAQSALDLIRLLVIAAIAGALVGLIGGAFSAIVHMLENKMLVFIAYLHEVDHNLPIPGFIVTSGIACIFVGIARFLVKLEPSTIGSGIQHVEAVMRNDATPSRFRALPIKFFGGLLSMSSGLVLGKEGPTVQMAAVIGSECGKLFRLKFSDQSLLYTAVAGAGLSVAFNAPLAGIAFSIEEITKHISLKRLMVSLTSVCTGIIVFRAYFGNAIEFVVGDLLPIDAISLCCYVLFSITLGLTGILYSRTVISALNVGDALDQISPVAKAMIIGAGIGGLAYFSPDWTGGGGTQINQILAMPSFLLPLLGMIAVRFLLGPISYMTGVPGGLFTPLLLIGTCLGICFVKLINPILALAHLNSLDPISFALVGMAAFFTVVVRSPLTGILLVIEMSGKVELMIPLLISSVICTLIPTVLKQEPIYDLLLSRKP